MTMMFESSAEVTGSDVNVGPNLEVEDDGSMSSAPALVIDGEQAGRAGSATLSKTLSAVGLLMFQFQDVLKGYH